MRERWVAAIFVTICALSPILMARPGTVLTKDNQTYDGDVTEDKTAGTVTVLIHNIPYGVKLANVQSILYVDEVDADVRRQALSLSPKDVKGRLALAQYAMSHHALKAARDVLVSAQKIEPDNAEVRDMLERVKTDLRKLEPPPAVAATQPATQPAVAIAPPLAVPATMPAATATREVTPDEVNVIRQSELRDGDSVRVRIEPDLRKRFVDYINMPMSDFLKLPPMQQAFMILDKGKLDMRRDLKILNDPIAITSFRKTVQRGLITGCATSKCHGGPDAGVFRLSTKDNETAAYTNFLVLQKTTARIGGKVVQMIDRQSPDQSLLLDYMLPAAITDHPHPDAKGYHGVARNRSDPRLAQIQAWIHDDLKPLTPDYSSIDLSRPPTTRPSGTAVAMPANP